MNDVIAAYERGETISALMFFFGNGYLLQVTPGAVPIVMQTGVEFGTGDPDEFGIRPHSHADVKFSAAENPADYVDPFSLVLKAAKTHGPPIHMAPVLCRKVGRFQVKIYSPPAGYRESGFVVAALGPKEGAPQMTTEEAVELAKAGGKISIPEHDHWFASDKPLPLSAAIWIFRSLTEENLVATDCNCGTKGPSPRQIMESLGLSTPLEQEPDEAFIGLGPR